MTMKMGPAQWRKRIRKKRHSVRVRLCMYGRGGDVATQCLISISATLERPDCRRSTLVWYRQVHESTCRNLCMSHEKFSYFGVLHLFLLVAATVGWFLFGLLLTICVRCERAIWCALCASIYPAAMSPFLSFPHIFATVLRFALAEMKSSYAWGSDCFLFLLLLWLLFKFCFFLCFVIFFSAKSI